MTPRKKSPRKNRAHEQPVEKAAQLCPELPLTVEASGPLILSSSPNKKKNANTIAAVAVGQIGLSKSFRKTTNPDKRSTSLRKIFRGLVFAAIAISRLRPRLSPSEVEATKQLYDTAGGVSSVTQLVLLMQGAGIDGSDEVCRRSLQEIGYREGHLLTFVQFRRAFEHCKRDQISRSRRNDSTRDAFIALGGGEDSETLDPENMANAIESFGLTLDVMRFASVASPVGSPVHPAPAAPSPAKMPPAKVQRVVCFDSFSKFFHSSDDAKTTEDKSPLMMNRTVKKAFALGDVMANQNGDPDGGDEWWKQSDDSEWWDIRSPAWSPPKGDRPPSTTGDKPRGALGKLSEALLMSKKGELPMLSAQNLNIEILGSSNKSPKNLSLALASPGPTSTRQVSAVVQPCESSAPARQGQQQSGENTSFTATLTDNSLNDVINNNEGTASSGLCNNAVIVVAQELESQSTKATTPTTNADAGRAKRPQSATFMQPSRTVAKSRRPDSAQSRAKPSPSSWANFLKRSEVPSSTSLPQSRVTSASPARKDFVVPVLPSGSTLLEGLDKSALWREGYELRGAELRLDIAPSSSSPSGNILVEVVKPPFHLRPQSACGRPTSAVRALRVSPSGATAPVTIRPVSAEEPPRCSNELMSRWCTGGVSAADRNAQKLRVSNRQ